MAQAKGNVLVLNAESKKNLTLRKAALSYLPCGELLDGAKVMFFNPHSQATLGSRELNDSLQCLGQDPWSR